MRLEQDRGSVQQRRLDSPGTGYHIPGQEGASAQQPVVRRSESVPSNPEEILDHSMHRQESPRLADARIALGTRARGLSRRAARAHALQTEWPLAARRVHPCNAMMKFTH